MFHPASSVSGDLLASWRWLVGGQPRFHGWSSAGDLFYADERGSIWRLDTGDGEPEHVAESALSFQHRLRDPNTVEELLLLPVVRAFEAVHGPLSDGCCLGFTTLPVFGGTYTIENRYALSVNYHADFTGAIHRQIRDLPDGARIQLKVVP